MVWKGLEVMGEIRLDTKNFQICTENCEYDVRNILLFARQYAFKQVNSVMVLAYWYIGRRIVLQEQNGAGRAEYGEQLIKKLSQKLAGEFGKGVSVAQLWNFRQFYVTFPDEKILYTLCRELSWSHLRLIMRLNTERERQYYIENCRNGNWSVRELERNIRTGMFHRVVKNQLTSSGERNNVLEIIKDPYILDFLNVSQDARLSEKDLETILIDNLQKFLMELGKGFSFVDRQMHIATETSDFYVDLVFYNYILKCFVLIDLKIDKLTHQDIGQMDMYVRMFDGLKRIEGDNPTVGIILCADKDETVVKYSVLSDGKQIFASKYMTVLPTEEELKAELERNRRYLQRP